MESNPTTGNGASPKSAEAEPDSTKSAGTKPASTKRARQRIHASKPIEEIPASSIDDRSDVLDVAITHKSASFRDVVEAYYKSQPAFSPDDATARTYAERFLQLRDIFQRTHGNIIDR